jgi:hypothetical protein
MPHSPRLRAPRFGGTLGVLGAITLVTILSACGPGLGEGEPPPSEPIPAGHVRIEVTATGGGRVVAPDHDFECRDHCTLDVAENDVIELRALPDPGRVTVAWDGPCAALAATCRWEAGAGTSVEARFAPHALRLDLRGDGQGRYEIAYGTNVVECREPCGVPYQRPLSVALTYKAEGSTRTSLGAWTGPCAGHDPGYCVVEVAGAVDVGMTWSRFYTLVVDLAGSGTGNVTSAPAGIDVARGQARADFLSGTEVTLAPEASADSVFAGWSGACATSGGGPCRLTLDADTDVTARFVAVEPDHEPLSVTVVGAGHVTSDPPGIDTAAGEATTTFPHGTTITLHATPTSDSTFTGWSGACTGTSTCTLTLTGPASATATFAPTAPPTHTLTVTLAGSGHGHVTSDPPGIDTAAGEATTTFPHGTTITLHATPTSDSTFTGWSGACTGTSTCTLTLDSDTTVTATFAIRVHTLEARTTGSGSGNVTSTPPGINLATGNATADFDHGTTVTLTAHPDPNSRFTGWSGACTGTSTCTLTLDAAATVTARFEVVRYTLTVTATGNGNVTSSPAGIDLATGDATADFDHGTTVTLTAHPNPDSRFTGWSGACTGTTTTCQLTMDGSKGVNAAFEEIRPEPPPPVVELSVDVEMGGNSQGRVVSVPAGIDTASGDTGATFPRATEVVLTATVTRGYFHGFSFPDDSEARCGDGSTLDTCVLQLDTATHVRATFHTAPARTQ